VRRGWGGRRHPGRALALVLLAALAVPPAIGAGPASAATTAASPTAAADRGSRPNILFILADDLSTLEMGAMPKVNARLEQKGTSFANAIVNVSLCCPSRATILRGQYGRNTGVRTNGGANGGFEAFYRNGTEQSTIATWLQDAGYRTALFGKYLNGYPNTEPNTYVPPGWDEWASPIVGYPYAGFEYTVNENGTLVPYGSQPEDYGTDVFVRKTQEFITAAAADQTPFFAFLSAYAPHNPATPAPRHVGLFPTLVAPRTPGFGEQDLSDKPDWLAGRVLKPNKLAKADEIFRQRARSLQALDEGVAALVDTLRANGQLENTYIVFMSDNGYHFGQHSMAVGKGTPYEEDIRVPLIIRGPGVLQGEIRRRLVGNDDIAPTFADLAGVTPPEFVDGRSLVPLFGAHRPTSWRHSFLLDHWREVYNTENPSTSPRGGALEPSELGGTERVSGKGRSDKTPIWHGLRTRRYAYIEYETGEKELYDLRFDPAQLSSIASSASEVLLATLHERLVAMRTCRAERCRDLEDQTIQTG
jgi:N-acetylglucosamine-6-sulfatase